MKVVVRLEGTGPWRYNYGNGLGSRSRYTDIPSDTLLLESKEPSSFFKLMSVSNACGEGKIKEPSVIKIEVVLGMEQSWEDLLSYGPNPTTGILSLNFQKEGVREIMLLGTNGVPVWQQKCEEPTVRVNLSEFPSGAYLLKILQNGKLRTVRIVKY